MNYYSQPPPPRPPLSVPEHYSSAVPIYMRDYNFISPQVQNNTDISSQQSYMPHMNPNFFYQSGVPHSLEGNPNMMGNLDFAKAPSYTPFHNNSPWPMHSHAGPMGFAEEGHYHNVPSSFQENIPPPLLKSSTSLQWQGSSRSSFAAATAHRQNAGISYGNLGIKMAKSGGNNNANVEMPPLIMQGNPRGAASSNKGYSHYNSSSGNSQLNLFSQAPQGSRDEMKQKETSSPREESPSSNNVPERGRERIHNDYNQHFVDTGERSQNFIRDAEESERFAEYPKLGKLMLLKKEVNIKRATPAQHIQANLRTFDLTSLKTKFDVILVDPPWAEYHLRVAGGFSPSEDLSAWTLDDMKKVRVDLLGETPSFCFLWCAVTHLEEARALLSHWGYRRCEDICWLKTNKRISQKRRQGNSFPFANVIHDEHSLLQRSKEHCLMGIKGTVRRSSDTHFIHANLDTDVIVDEEPEELGSTAKPKELYDIIERFCLGRKRIELFGTDRNIRNGWVTVGKAITFTNFDANEYNGWFEGDVAWPEVQDYRGGRYTGSTTEIEQLRPKSPPRPPNNRQEDTATGGNQNSGSANQNTKRQKFFED